MQKRKYSFRSILKFYNHQIIETKEIAQKKYGPKFIIEVEEHNKNINMSIEDLQEKEDNKDKINK